VGKLDGESLEDTGTDQRISSESGVGRNRLDRLRIGIGGRLL